MKPSCFVVACILLLAVHSSTATGYSQGLCRGRRHSCRSIKKCVPLVKVCDGKDDCGDNSDEERCGRAGREQQGVPRSRRQWVVYSTSVPWK